MSNWLNNMNNLLTKLDDQVETVVEERAFAQDDLSRENINAARSGIDDILAKRGLSSINSKNETYNKEEEPIVEKKMVQEDDDNEDDKQYVQDEKKSDETKTIDRVAIEYTNVTDTKETESFDYDSSSTTAEKEIESQEVDKLIENSSVVKGQHLPVQQNSVATSLKDHGEEDYEVEKKDMDSEIVSPQKVEKGDEKREWNTIKRHGIIASPKLSTFSKSKDESSPSSLTQPPIVVAGQVVLASSLNQEQKHGPYAARSPDPSRKEIRELVLERKEAQKEARTLRRHIVSLNDQLETAELELQAQRKELERAAARMEKDRSQHKVEKEASQKRNIEEITQSKTQYEKSLNDQQARFEEQLERYRKKLSDEEKRRKQQGGNWDKEMSNAIDREQNIRQKLNLLEDEKAVLLSQISTLQGQQTALGSRLESLSEAADNAIQRERDAENRLDAALNQHARQIGYRQARESQLERTIQDLNAALVISRSNPRPPGNNNSGCDGGTDHSMRGNSFEARMNALELNLQTANSNLAIEKERSETLQVQLRSFSNETSQEASIVHAKEIQYDRRIADLSITISKLEEKLRQYEKLTTNNSPASIDSLDDQKIPQEIKVLSEEVVRLRDKIANHGSESLAMKNRLKAAVERSNKLEDELQMARISSNSDEPLYDAKRQGRHNTSSGRRRNFGDMYNSSIRTAMMLNSTRSERTEQIGEVVDQIDSFASSTGKYLRRNPLARAGFIFYLILMHLWTFVLLFFHVHSLDTTAKGDFNDGVVYSHGPNAMMQQQKIMKNLELH